MAEKEDRTEILRGWYGRQVTRPWLRALSAVVVGLALLFVGVVIGGGTRDHIIPTGTLVAGIIAATVAYRRHVEQTKADFQRRITESFTKAVEQLGSDKLQVRIGGIYALERISKECPDDYWTIMETLTAFVRERAPWKGSKGAVAPANVVRIFPDVPEQHSRREPPTDIAAVLAVIMRRDVQNRKREHSNGWCLDLRSTDLRGGSLSGAHLERADLSGAHLERATLQEAHFEEAVLERAHLEGAFLGEAYLEEAHLSGACLEGAVLWGARLRKAFLGSADLSRAILWSANLKEAFLAKARLDGAELSDANLEGAQLSEAHLNSADLRGANLAGASLWTAHLEGAQFEGAHLDGANLRGSADLSQEQIDKARGNAETKLPEGLTPPAHWLQAPEDADKRE
jgi:uncharacterized protein YjbI with pentapeptide repeats